MDHEADGLSGKNMKGLKAAFTTDVGKKVIEAHSTASFTKEVGAFLQSWQNNKGDSKKVINNFVSNMAKYGIKVTVK
ncbi:hypothetical protein [Chitinophaga niabensis]|uniref:Uncharacterized protein n=1 Tax=Chitinophaga niabensis TaxID=536979 RepID=A0A1N6DQI5_9BACT|nr:hypothetical protein [Chitinophaga niabensis]SIN73062.1 hypothetical protein SAMN04488055_0997 [Chitinophaga niabensis]